MKLALLFLLSCKYLASQESSAFTRVVRSRSNSLSSGSPTHMLSPISPLSLSRLRQDAEVELMQAIGKNDSNWVDSIIKSGVNVNCIDIDKTPLGLAARKGYADMMRKLIAAGAVVDFGLSSRSNLRGLVKSDLMLAVESGSFEAVDCILRCGADPAFEASENGATALGFAVEAGRLDMVKSIVPQYKDKLCLSRHVTKVLVTALNRGRVDIAKYITDSSAGYRVDPSSLIFAIKSNKIETVKFILGLSVFDLNIPDFNGFTYLDFALTFRKMDIVKFLIASGSDVSGRSGEWALRLAVQSGDIELVRELIQHRVNVNVRYDDLGTPLSLARGYRQDAITALLVAHGAQERQRRSCNIL